MCYFTSNDGYITYFDNSSKNITFVTDNEKVYDKYNEIWEGIRKLLKVKFTVNPVRDDKYLVAKLKIFNRINRTIFNNNKNNIPVERNHYICIPAIDIDSVLKIDNKRANPQAYLEQCKYKLKKRKIVNYIDDEIIDEDSDSDIDDAVDSHLNFSVPDSYVEILIIIIMNDNAIIPTRHLDLCSSIDVDIEVGSIKKVNTGICISLPENSYGSIRDKSSLASKGLLTLGGVIDKDYTGETIVIMTSLIEPIKIKKIQKIAQLIVSNIMYPETKKVRFLKDTERNNKGFGEMDEINFSKGFSDEVFEYFSMYNYKT